VVDQSQIHARGISQEAAKPKMSDGRDWPRYAKALDMRLAGAAFADIAEHLDVSKQRAGQMVTVAKAQLAYRVFKGVPRPLPPPAWERKR
jgi:hypothetical protein